MTMDEAIDALAELGVGENDAIEMLESCDAQGHCIPDDADFEIHLSDPTKAAANYGFIIRK